MSSLKVRINATALVALLLVAASAAPTSLFDRNLQRLRTIPYEERLVLAKNLERYDALPPEARERIAAIDARINALEPDTRENYLATLRRYHLWMSTLDPKTKEQILSAGSDSERLAVLEKTIKSGTRSHLAPSVLGLPIGDIGSIAPIELSNLIRVWFKLSDEEKRRIDALPIARRISEIQAIGAQRKIEVKRLPDASLASAKQKLDELPLLKSLQSGLKARQEKLKAESKIGLLAKKKFESRPQILANPYNHLIESVYFLDNPPKRVEPANLSRFADALPNWVRDSIDPLPASEARRRLSILYREIYPDPEEMPAPARSAAKKAGPAKVAPSDNSAITPF